MRYASATRRVNTAVIKSAVFKTKDPDDMINRPQKDFPVRPSAFRGENRRTPGEGGFTLLETLVAIMILSVALVIVLELFSSNLRSTTFSENYSRGIFHARMKMEELLSQNIPTVDAEEGRFEDGFRWKTSLSPYGEQEPGAGPAAYVATVEVFWEQGASAKSVTLSSLGLLDRPEEL